MGSILRTTRVLKIPMTNVDSFLATVARSSSTTATRVRRSSSSADRSCMSNECWPHGYSSASFTSCTSMSISYREMRIWHSSNIWLILLECLELEVKACILARYSCQAASTWAHSVSCSMHAHPATQQWCLPY
jgi:hypothetical protein